MSLDGPLRALAAAAVGSYSIIFCTVVVGIAGMEDMKKVGKTGGLALLYFEIVSSIVFTRT
jgi:Na+/H+-dicarboxylate symporter